MAKNSDHFWFKISFRNQRASFLLKIRDTFLTQRKASSSQLDLWSKICSHWIFRLPESRLRPFSRPQSRKSFLCMQTLQVVWNISQSSWWRRMKLICNFHSRICVKPLGPFGPASKGSKEQWPQESPTSRSSQWFDCPCPWRTARKKYVNLEGKNQHVHDKEFVCAHASMSCALHDSVADVSEKLLQDRTIHFYTTTILVLLLPLLWKTSYCDNDDLSCALHESVAHNFPALPEKLAGHSQGACLRRQWYLSLVKGSLTLVSCVERSNELWALESPLHDYGSTNILI